MRVTQTLKTLNNRFAEHQHIVFEESENGIILIKVNHPLATATVSLAGGQVLEWKPASQAVPVLWNAEPQYWHSDRPIRAGVPLCWPWFGPHATADMAPSHGYARLCAWEVVAISEYPSGAIEIDLRMSASHDAATLYPLNATLETRISIGAALSIALTTTNTGKHTISYTEALHAYFNVSDIRDTSIQGLDGCDFIDLIDQNKRKKQANSVQIAGETGRVYLNTTSDCWIVDRAYGRTIHIEKSGSQSTVIWNPWLETASKMHDLGRSAWQRMLCVESANALENAVTLEAGRQHTLQVKYSVIT